MAGSFQFESIGGGEAADHAAESSLLASSGLLGQEPGHEQQEKEYHADAFGHSPALMLAPQPKVHAEQSEQAGSHKEHRINSPLQHGQHTTQLFDRNR